MSITYVLENLQQIAPIMLLIMLFLGYFIFSKFYIKNKKKTRKTKRQVEATGKYFLFLAIFTLIVFIFSGVKISKPNLSLLVASAVIALSLIYLDGWLTEKAVGGYSAVEGNPIMSLLFKKFKIRNMRLYIFGFMLGIIVGCVVTKALSPLFVICMGWILVDGNNIIVWRKMQQRNALIGATLRDEIGFDDIHEL